MAIYTQSMTTSATAVPPPDSNAIKSDDLFSSSDLFFFASVRSENVLPNVFIRPGFYVEGEDSIRSFKWQNNSEKALIICARCGVEREWRFNREVFLSIPFLGVLCEARVVSFQMSLLGSVTK